MKKFFVILAVALIGISASAQKKIGLTVGGSAGFTFSSAGSTTSDGTNKAKDKISSGVSFKILPEVGFQLSKQMTVGASFGYMNGYAALGAFDLSDFKGIANLAVGTASDLYLNGKVDGMEMSKIRLNGIRFAPFIRYTLLHSKWVDLFAEGGLGYNMLFIKDNKEGEMQFGHIFDVLARPGLAINLGDSFQITAKVGSIGLQTGAISIKENDGGDTIKTTTHATRFGFDVDSSNLLLGLSWKF